MNNLFAYGKAHHSDFIIQLIKSVNCKNYLELGIYDGDTLSRVSPFVNRAIGVDIKDIRKNKSSGEFYLSNTDEFFKTFNDKMDVIFIDADHNVESVKRDFINSLNILNEFGIIILHDTDPIEKKLISPFYCGDSYKIIDWIRKEFPLLNVFTLPISEAGLTIINRSQDRRVNKFI